MPTAHYSTLQAAQQITRVDRKWGDPAPVEWEYLPGAPVVVSYGFSSGAMAMSAAGISATETALGLWSDVAMIGFTREYGGPAGKDPYTDGRPSILFSHYETNVEEPGRTFGGPVPEPVNVKLNLYNWNQKVTRDPSELNYSTGSGLMATLIHETGHAIGLQHPGSYDAPDRPNYGTDAVYVEDTMQYSVMSYFAATETGANYAGTFIRTPLLHDIAAAQRLYGANLETRTGNTHYGFYSNADRDAFKIDSNSEKVVFAIWDAGGTDTLDLSGYTAHQRIDLRPGHFTSAGGLTNNIAVAEAVDANGRLRGSDGFDPTTIVNYIENAIGGSGNDTIYGNAAVNTLVGGSGDDTLHGLEGNDTLYGGENNDRLNGGSGDDTMSGGRGNDTYVVDSPGDVIFEYSNLGTDTVETTLLSYSLSGLPEVENLTFDDKGFFRGSFTGQGNGKANVLTGGVGEDKLLGFAGADTLIGGAGGDLLDGGSSNDTASYATATGGVTADLGLGRGTAGHAAGDVYVSIENLVGSRYGDTLTGSSIGNVLDGGAGGDTIRGGAGSDRILGGTGNDTLYGDLPGGVDYADTFVFTNNWGVDEIRDWDGFDVIAFQGVSGLTSLDQIKITPFDGQVTLLSYGDQQISVYGKVDSSDLILL